MMSNGVHHEVPEFLGPKRMINRQEYIRLMEQSLHRLGFTVAAQQLERDSVQPPLKQFLLSDCTDLVMSLDGITSSRSQARCSTADDGALEVSSRISNTDDACLQGIQMQPITVTEFQDHIFNGRWDAALALLPQLTYDPNVALQARLFP